jgi:hypothetical protein
MSNTLLAGPLSGRFLIPLDGPLPEAARFSAPSADPQRFRTPDPPVDRVLGFCSSGHPHDDQLETSREELAYDQGGGDVYRYWIREDVRQPPTSAVTAAARAAFVADGGLDWDRLSRVDKQPWTAAARTDLVRRTPPRTRLFEGLGTKDWLWIGTTNEDVWDLFAFETSDRRPFLGRVGVDPLAWDPVGTFAWSSFARTVIESFVLRGAALESDCSVTEISVRDTSFRCTTSAADQDHHRDAISRIMSKGDAEVRTISFEVRLVSGEICDVQFDAKGLRRALPPPSCGGFFEEQLRRRFGDVREAAARAGEIVARIHAEFLEQQS